MTFRYRWRFAVPILRTLINDIPIVLGVYAISGREVTADTVAAMLTILGYSIYDTIIVFDRVRENMRLMPRASIATIANVSVSEVLKRSIVTSSITLLPIVALFIFGGATLRDFAFAIMVGIAVGAVSTIFIATPLLVGLMERDPEYARPARARCSTGPQSAGARSRGPSVPPPREPTPLTPMDEIEQAIEQVVEPSAGRQRVAGGEARAAPQQRRAVEASWTTSVTTSSDDAIQLERLLSLLGPRVDELRSLLDDATSRWRGDALRVGEGDAPTAAARFFTSSACHARGLGRARPPRRPARAPAAAARRSASRHHAAYRRSRAVRAGRPACRPAKLVPWRWNGGQSGPPVRSRLLRR